MPRTHTTVWLDVVEIEENLLWSVTASSRRLRKRQIIICLILLGFASAILTLFMPKTMNSSTYCDAFFAPTFQYRCGPFMLWFLRIMSLVVPILIMWMVAATVRHILHPGIDQYALISKRALARRAGAQIVAQAPFHRYKAKRDFLGDIRFGGGHDTPVIFAGLAEPQRERALYWLEKLDALT